MKLATTTSVLFYHGLRDAIRIVSELGYDGIDLWGGRPHVYRDDFGPDELAEIRRDLEAAELGVSSLMPAFYHYPHSLSNPNPRIVADSIDYMRMCVDNAVVLGAKHVLVVPDMTLIGESRDASLRRFISATAEIADYAAQRDMRLGIELLYSDETDLYISAVAARDTVHRIGRDNVGVVVDCGALHLSKEVPSDVFSTLSDVMLQVHVSDHHGGPTQENLIPGDGTYDFPAFITALGDIGYDGYVSVELSKGYALDAQSALSTAATRMRTWMSHGS